MAHIKSRKHRNTASLVALAAAFPLTVQAAETENKAVQLPTIKVAAGAENTYKKDKLSSAKFTQPLVNTTQTAAIIPENILKEQNAATLTEALRNVPGVGTFSLGENGRMNTGDAISMRGFDSSNSIFVDGIRDLGNVTRDVFNTEQIEVFKGPAGTDNGRTAASGSINLTTKKPKAEDFTRASLGAGSDSYYRTTADINRKLSDSTALRLNVMGEKADGIGRDGVENKKWAVAPSIAFGLGTDLRVYLDYLHTEQDNITDGGIPTVGLKGADATLSSNAVMKSLGQYLNSNPVDRSAYYGSKDDFDDVQADMATARIEYDLSDKTVLTNTSRWGKTTHQYLSSFAGNNVSTASADLSDLSAYQVGRSSNNGDSENEILTNQTSLVTGFNTGKLEHSLSTGAEFTREKMKTFSWTAALTPTLNSLYNPDKSLSTSLTRNLAGDVDGQMDTYSVFAFDTIQLSPRVAVNGGIRLDHYKFESTKADVTSKDSGNLFNWKTGILFKPAENGSLYANYAIQQQPPGTITGGDGVGNGNAFDTNTTNNNFDFDPQEIKTAEVGAKWEFLDKRLLLTGALFQTEVTNEIEKDPVLANVYYQTGKKSVKGIELGAVGNLNDNWQVIAGYTHQKTKISNVDSLASGSYASAEGDNLPFTPSDAFTLWSTYKLDKWSIGSGARYTGEMSKNKDGNKAGPSEIPDYWVFDSMIGYQATKNIGLQLNINNLFDEDYIASINRGGGRYIPGAERNYRFTVNFSF